MASFDYTYVFGDLSDTPNAVKLFEGNIAVDVVSTCKVAIDDSQLLSLHQTPEEVADLIDLAVSVYVADRLSIRKAPRLHRTQIHVVVPVRRPDRRQPPPRRTGFDGNPGHRAQPRQGSGAPSRD